MRRIPLFPAMTAAALLAALVGPAAVSAKEALTPLVVDWANYFTIESEVSPAGDPITISGTVHNTTGWTARRIQLLVQGTDASGTVVRQQVVWLGEELAPGTHAFFRVPVRNGSIAAWRVSVFAFDSSRHRSP